MPEHYPKNVISVSAWCDTCRRLTQHRVDHKRLGSCTEHAAEGLSRKQEKTRQEQEETESQPGLF